MTPDSVHQEKIARLEARLAKQTEAEQLRHKIMVGAATRTGKDYFNQTTLELCQALEADFTLIGEIIDQQRGRVRSLALCAADRLVDNIEYDLYNTPCELVLSEGICSHPRQVAELFPKDQMLTEMQIEGYVGVPLYDKGGEPLGLIVALYHQPIADPLFAETTLQLFANLTSAEILRLHEHHERLKMEKTLVQSEKMLSLGGVAAGMAHEINNPLAGILQNLQLLNSRLLQTAPANQQAAQEAGIEMAQLIDYLQRRKVPQMLDMMNAAGKRAAGIVQNMLSFSRKESGTLRPCRMDEVVRQAIELARSDYDLTSSYDFRNISIDCQFPENLPQVLGVNSQLQQVLFNLLKNSAQAMANWPEMRVPPRIEIRLKSDRHRLRIEIMDNGPGISSELQKRIFEPFFTTKAVGQGTGLGLSVSYFIITETHRGALSVSSKPGKGTIFRISLPRVDNEPMYHI